jgi:KUP system potassium uptake protein
MVSPSGKASGMAGWKKSLFATIHLKSSLPAAQVVEVGLEAGI